MWNLLKRENEECRRLRDSLEIAGAKHPGAPIVSILIAELSAQERKHIEICPNCREAVQELVATKELFRGARSFAEEDRPWFAARVMAAIASRERELAERVSAWTEFPRFASRLSLVAVIVLLAGTTWFYQAVVRAPSYAPSGQESIFETPQQSAPDDVLVSMAADHP